MTAVSPGHLDRTALLRLLVFWAASLLIGSLMPLRFKLALHTTRNHHFIHPLLHLIAFAVLALLLYGILNSHQHRLFGLLAVVTFGFTLEWLEMFVYSQKLETGDILLDTYGAFAGYLLLFAVHQFGSMKPREPNKI